MILEFDPDQIEFRFSRAGGPGGQNVNKVSTRATLLYAFDRDPRWDVSARDRLHRKLITRLSADGRIMVTCSRHRTQRMNRDESLVRLGEIVEAALRRAKPRHATRPTRASKERRLTAKRREGERKQTRKIKNEE